jgi:hypothetical protein
MPCESAWEARRLNRMDIANVEAALKRVRGFITLLEENYGIYNTVGSMSPENPHLRGSDNQIQEQLPLIKRIAERADSEIARKLTEDSLGWPYYRMREASLQLAGLLDSLEEAAQILGPVGPKPGARARTLVIPSGASSAWVCLAGLQYVDGLGELSRAPGAAAELAEDPPGLELGVRPLAW